ncbi:uncharacterized protein LOC142600681, partial [Balearica regulorum gibbericeps]|uniref:uncharacterized protein LOC142600681 n=1 Tax=Balearica regulorum gibbericeps TaxID=100784 RepID=UPI003F60CF5A
HLGLGVLPARWLQPWSLSLLPGPVLGRRGLRQLRSDSSREPRGSFPEVALSSLRVSLGVSRSRSCVCPKALALPGDSPRCRPSARLGAPGPSTPLCRARAASSAVAHPAACLPSPRRAAAAGQKPSGLTKVSLTAPGSGLSGPSPAARVPAVGTFVCSAEALTHRSVPVPLVAVCGGQETLLCHRRGLPASPSVTAELRARLCSPGTRKAPHRITATTSTITATTITAATTTITATTSTITATTITAATTAITATTSTITATTITAATTAITATTSTITATTSTTTAITATASTTTAITATAITATAITATTTSSSISTRTATTTTITATITSSTSSITATTSTSTTSTSTNTTANTTTTSSTTITTSTSGAPARCAQAELVLLISSLMGFVAAWASPRLGAGLSQGPGVW